MNENTFSKILLIQACEESDPHGRHLPTSTRHHATQQAKDKYSPSSDLSDIANLPFLTARSEILWSFLEKAFPTFGKFWKPPQFDFPIILIATPAFFVGLLINGLGDSQRVNLLNFPLLLLLLWNFGTYLFSTLLPLFNSSMKTTWFDSGVTWLAKFLGNQRQPPRLPGNLSDPEISSWVQEATKRFTSLLWPHIQPVWTDRLRQFLHLGAAFVAMGVLSGLYIRGLALDYQATWESTFLSATQVHEILQILLGPAAWLLEYPFPNISEISRLEAPKHGPAAMWIHLWAVTIIAVIVIPRMTMAWLKQRSLSQVQESFALPLNDPYFVHLLAPDRGQGVHVDVLPYSYHPSPEAKNFLGNCFLDLFGNLASIQWHQPIPFGHEFSSPTETSTNVQTSVVIFNAGQTPEGEVQGEWLHSMQTQIGKIKANSKLLVLLDEEPYRQAFDEQRVTERQQAWQRLIRQYHLSLVPFNPTTTSPNHFLQQTQAGLWPQSG